jgi:hypothetical protein
MPDTDTGERVTDVLDVPSRDGLAAGDAFYAPPGALHSVSRNASEEVPASFIAFFVLGDGESPTVDDA